MHQLSPTTNCRGETRARANTRRLGDLLELSTTTTDACNDHISLYTIPNTNLPPVPLPTYMHHQAEASRTRKSDSEMRSRDGGREARNGPPTHRMRASPHKRRIQPRPERKRKPTPRETMTPGCDCELGRRHTSSTYLRRKKMRLYT